MKDIDDIVHFMFFNRKKHQDYGSLNDKDKALGYDLLKAMVIQYDAKDVDINKILNTN